MGGPTNIDDDEVQSTRAEAVDEMLAAVRSLRGSKPILCQLQFQTERIISLSCLVVTAPSDVPFFICFSLFFTFLFWFGVRLSPIFICCFLFFILPFLVLFGVQILASDCLSRPQVVVVVVVAVAVVVVFCYLFRLCTERSQP